MADLVIKKRPRVVAAPLPDTALGYMPCHHRGKLGAESKGPSTLLLQPAVNLQSFKYKKFKMYIRKNLFKQKCRLKIKSPPLPQSLRAERGPELTGHIFLAAYSPAVPRGQDHFPEGPGAPDPAAGRLLLRLEDLQSKFDPAQDPGLQRGSG